MTEFIFTCIYFSTWLLISLSHQELFFSGWATDFLDPERSRKKGFDYINHFSGLFNQNVNLNILSLDKSLYAAANSISAAELLIF